MAVLLFDHIMEICKTEKIIPRESVVRCKALDTAAWDFAGKAKVQSPPGLKSWTSLGLEFDVCLSLSRVAHTHTHTCCSTVGLGRVAGLIQCMCRRW